MKNLTTDLRLSIGQTATKFVGEGIMLTGSARSGTTVMGQLLASCRGVEYGFEPPTLVSLFSVIEKVSGDIWKLLYETYVYEELLLGSIAGRYLNTNMVDDSSAYNYMSESEISERLSVSARKHSLESQLVGMQHHACFKIPDLIPVIPTIRSYYPEMRIVVMRRNAQSTIHSLLQKGWFEPGVLGDQSTRIYPFKQVKQTTGHQLNIPYWVASEDEPWWIEADVIQRCLYYYILNTPSSDCGCHVVNYEQMITDPQPTFKQLIKSLGIEKGVKTDSILDSVKPQKHSYHSKDFDADPFNLKAIVPTLPPTLYQAAERMDPWGTR